MQILLQFNKMRYGTSDKWCIFLIYLMPSLPTWRNLCTLQFSPEHIVQSLDHWLTQDITLSKHDGRVRFCFRISEWFVKTKEVFQCKIVGKNLIIWKSRTVLLKPDIWTSEVCTMEVQLYIYITKRFKSYLQWTCPAWFWLCKYIHWYFC